MHKAKTGHYFRRRERANVKGRIMDRRNFLKAVGAAAVAPAIGGPAEAVSKQKPNVLIIMTDQHRADLMTCAGRELVPTPNIDRIAERGDIPYAGREPGFEVLLRFFREAGDFHAVRGTGIHGQNAVTAAAGDDADAAVDGIFIAAQGFTEGQHFEFIFCLDHAEL